MTGGRRRSLWGLWRAVKAARAVLWAVRGLLSLILASGFALAAAAALVGVPTAQAADSPWWLPSAWVTSTSGTAAEAAGYMTGAGGSVSNSPALALGGWNGSGASTVTVQLEGNQANGLPILSYVVELGFPNPPSWPVDGAFWGQWNPGAGYGNGKATCVDGTANQTVAWASGAASVSGCNVRGGVRQIDFVFTGTDTSRSWQSWTWYAGQDALVTTLTCRNLATGVDTTVTETSASGSAAAPLCPAGTVAVRVRITQGSVVLQDASISTGALSTYAGYLGDPGAWEWGQTDPGNCFIQRSDDPTMVIVLSLAICNEAAENGVVGPATEVPSCAEDVVCQAVERLRSESSRLLSGILGGLAKVVQAIKDMQTGVREDLNEIKEKIDGSEDPGPVDPGTGVPTGSPACEGQTVTNAANPVEWVKDGVECALTPNQDGINEDLDRMRDGIGKPLEGWEDALGDVAAAWSMTPGSCAGPELRFPLGPPVGTFTLHPLDACSQPMATVAVISKLVATVLMLSAAAWAAAGAVAAGLGYSGGGS